jgi:hypothetical protein
MALTLVLVLAAAAFITCVMAAMGKAPLWVAVLLLCVIALMRILPGG